METRTIWIDADMAHVILGALCFDGVVSEGPDPSGQEAAEKRLKDALTLAFRDVVRLYDHDRADTFDGTLTCAECQQPIADRDGKPLATDLAAIGGRIYHEACSERAWTQYAVLGDQIPPASAEATLPADAIGGTYTLKPDAPNLFPSIPPGFQAGGLVEFERETHYAPRPSMMWLCPHCGSSAYHP